jgi:predicted heme/steroid binding protein
MYNAMNTEILAMRELTLEEIDAVSGAVIPVAVAIAYGTMFMTSAAGGWTFGQALFS